VRLKAILTLYRILIWPSQAYILKIR